MKTNRTELLEIQADTLIVEAHKQLFMRQKEYEVREKIYFILLDSFTKIIMIVIIILMIIIMMIMIIIIVMMVVIIIIIIIMIYYYYDYYNNHNNEYNLTKFQFHY